MKKFYILSVTFLLYVITSYSQPGSLDITFGQGGKVYTNIDDVNRSRDGIAAMAIQADGKIVVVGTSALPDYPQGLVPSMIMRYHPDGSLDNSFDYDGQVFVYGFKFTAIAIQPDGKILAAGSNFALIRLNANGTFDNSFGNGGTTTVISGSTVKAMALQADGKIVLGGFYNDGSSTQFALGRFNADGTPDNSFDGDGMLITDFGPGNEEIRDLEIQADGKIVVAGYMSNGASNSVALARYDVNGVLDNSLDVDGKQTASFGTANDYGVCLAIQPDGNIVVLGNANGYLALVRFTGAGGLDNTFDGDGSLVSTSLSGSNFRGGLTLQNDGKILAAVQSSGDFGVFRFNSNGNPDNSFDGDGKVATDLSTDVDYPMCIAVQSNGRIFVGGFSLNHFSQDCSIACYNADGSLDNGFNGNGKLVTVWGVSWDIGQAIAIQNDGKIIVGGTTANEDISSSHDFAIARYNANGTLDNTFSGDGRLVFDAGSDSRINALAMQTDGKIIAAGRSRFSSSFDIVVARFNSDGTADNSFDGDGFVGIVPSTSVNENATAVAVLSDGKILVAGSSLLIRLNSNGSLDNNFDGDGIMTIPITSTVSMQIQNDGKILVAGTNNADFAIARYNSNGSPDNSFDGDGLVMTDFGSTSEGISSIKLLSNGQIIAGGISGNGFALARYNSDGSLDNSFDGDGKQTTDLTGNGTNINAGAVDIQDNGKIVMSGYLRVGNDNFFATRYNSDGSIDNSFDGDGKLMLDLGPGADDRLLAMTINSNRIYLVGFTTTVAGFDFAIAAVIAEPLNGSLPLQLRDFSGKRVNNDAQLNWKTELESDMLEYVVERSIDGRNYSDVGVVAAANRTPIHNYYFTDYNITSLNAPVMYYRLRQKSIDGKHTYSRIIALSLEKNKNIVLLYPNPVINEINLALTADRQDKLQVRIMDNTGRLIKQQPWNVSAGSTSLTIDVTKLNKGIYYLEIKGESIDYKQRFIK